MQKSIKCWCVGFLFLFGALGASVVWGHAPDLLAANHPQQYEVKSGDTLWDIAGMFLNEPWRWPDVWHLNPEIENPHLIYPGDVIYFQEIDGRPQLVLKRNGHGGVVKLTPKVHVGLTNEAIPTIPLSVIGPFLNHSRVIDEAVLQRSPKVVALEDDRLMAGMSDTLYVTGCMEPLQKEYVVFRKGDEYQHPITKASLGLEAEMLGRAYLKLHDRLSSFVLIETKQEIRIGNRLLPADFQRADPYFMPHLPAGPAEGYLISVFGGVNQIGQHHVVVMTGGYDIGRQEGDVLAIYRAEREIPSRLLEDGEVPYKFPKLDIGKLMVFKVFDKVSFGLVMQAIRPIYLHDEVGSP